MTVRLYSATEGARIRYSIDGSRLTVHSLSCSSGEAIVVDTLGITTFMASAFKDGLCDSPTVIKKYLILERCSKPTITPSSGTFAGSVELTFRTQTLGGRIYFTTDGSIPTMEKSAYFNSQGTLVVTEGVTIIKAFTAMKGKASSSVTTATFTVLPKTKTPSIFPLFNTFSVSATLTLSCSTPNASIFYTINGDDPTPSSLSIANGHQLTVDSPGYHVIKAIATHPDMLPSDIASREFAVLLRARRPDLRPPPGTYVGTITIVFQCDTEEGSSGIVYYTFDGVSTPTTLSQSVACNSDAGLTLHAPGRFVLRAFSEVAGMSASAIVEATYYLQLPQYDTYPVTVGRLRIDPELAVFSIEKTFRRRGEQSCDCSPQRVVTGRLVVLSNPVGHFDIIAPAGGCGKGGKSLPSDTLRASGTAHHSLNASAFLRSIVSRVGKEDARSLLQNLSRHSAESSRPFCVIATNAGPFNDTSGECVGHVISGGHVLHTTKARAVSFGLRNGSYVVGYLDEDDVAYSAHLFDNLVTGTLWLVRHGESHVLDSIETLDLTEERRRMIHDVAARTVVGYDTDGRLLVLSVEGRSGVHGVNMVELADWCVELGFVSAVSLDGAERSFLMQDGVSVTPASGSCNGHNAIEGALPFIRCEEEVGTILCIHSFAAAELLFEYAGQGGNEELSTVTPSSSPSLNSDRPSALPTFSSIPSTTPSRRSDAPSQRPTIRTRASMSPTSRDNDEGEHYSNQRGGDNSIDAHLSSSNFSCTHEIASLKSSYQLFQVVCLVLVLALSVSLFIHVRTWRSSTQLEDKRKYSQLSTTAGSSHHANDVIGGGVQMVIPDSVVHDEVNIREEMEVRSKKGGLGLGPGLGDMWQQKLGRLDLDDDSEDEEDLRSSRARKTSKGSFDESDLETVELYGGFRQNAVLGKKERKAKRAANGAYEQLKEKRNSSRDDQQFENPFNRN